MRKGKIDDEGYRVIGKRHHCDKADKEAGEVSARWQRDIAVLGKHGFGVKSLADFNATRTQHSKLREDRPKAVAAKMNSVDGRDAAVEKGWAWVGKAVSVVGRVARSDSEIATELDEARPTNDAELAPRIGTLAVLLGKVKERVDTEADVDARVAEAPALQAALGDAPGKVAVAKAEPVEDTAALDILDGKLYIVIRDVNEAARGAIRNGELRAEANDYRLHHLSQNGKPAPAVTPPPPPPNVT